MDSNALGKKIKSARMAKKMTQSQVVGDFITRNMLSQIESGTAMPSVKTLEYLCSVLDIPMDTFQYDVDSADLENYLTLKSNYINGNYNEVADAEIPEDFKDEAKSLKARACYKIASEYVKSDDPLVLQKAISYANECMGRAVEGIFSDEFLKANAAKLVKEAASRLTEYYSGLV